MDTHELNLRDCPEGFFRSGSEYPGSCLFNISHCYRMSFPEGRFSRPYKGFLGGDPIDSGIPPWCSLTSIHHASLHKQIGWHFFIGINLQNSVVLLNWIYAFPTICFSNAPNGFAVHISEGTYFSCIMERRSWWRKICHEHPPLEVRSVQRVKATSYLSSSLGSKAQFSFAFSSATRARQRCEVTQTFWLAMSRNRVLV